MSVHEDEAMPSVEQKNRPLESPRSPTPPMCPSASPLLVHLCVIIKKLFKTSHCVKLLKNGGSCEYQIRLSRVGPSEVFSNGSTVRLRPL